MKKEITILTWNINQWPVVGWSRRCREDLEAVRSMIRDFDIVCLQECWSAAGRELRWSFPHHHLDGARSFTGFGSGLLCLSQYPVYEGRSHRYRGRRLPDSLAAKGIALARVRVPGFGGLDIINTHLQRWRGRTTRRRQVLELEGFVKSAAENSVAVLAGDLNIRPTSWGYRHLVASLPLRDVFEGCPVRTGREAGPRSPVTEDRVDHLFLSHANGAEVEIVESGRLGAAEGLPRYPSDHNGLFARIRLGKGTK